ncbi:uncharacterized protein LOC108089283 [Drosophila ficusphila]|uniref:uncharacterized protein LOC108089283 n=1 Tax=Drosophila ficusphila TaxID=30025 RepID=UPI0007E8AB08|nr:uncharacterized protein LOC108089283 [Drosophila ficusphila]
MSAANIEELNDDCLRYIMEYLSTEDRISFAQVGQRFRQVFINGNYSKYSDFTIDLNSTRNELIQFCICREKVKSLTIVLHYFDRPEYARNYGCVAPVNCFQILCLNLAAMINLVDLVVKQQYMISPPVDEPFHRVLAAVRHLPRLKKLKIQAREDCNVDSLTQLHHIEHLEILIPKIPIEILVKICKSNANLRNLQLGYWCVQKNLGDIVPYCKNLEVLNFGNPGASSDFVALGRLPKLRELYFFGIRGFGSFESLLSRFATKKQLTHLSIDCVSLVPQETKHLIRIQGLRYLKCFCPTIETVEMLATLLNLEELCLSMTCSLDITNALLLIIAKCTKLKILQIPMGIVNGNILKDATANSHLELILG